MSSHYLRIFQQPKSAILLIGFASGLPLALTSGTLQAWMTVANVDLKTIGFFSLVGQAYVFKFLWSPMMDRYTPPFLGRRRGWLLLTQLGLLASIAAMGFLSQAVICAGWRDWRSLSLCSASQDIVFDAWKTDATRRGAGSRGSNQRPGLSLGMLVSGGLALWLADRWLGWQGMYWLMAGC
jgi:PAT family beta-lactamase induction signal transducer AmpG